MKEKSYVKRKTARTIIENRQFPGAVDISTTPDVEVL